MKVEDSLKGLTSILLDTAPIIYHLERNPSYEAVMSDFFRVRARHRIVLLTSPVTLAECLVHPIQRGLAELETAYNRLIVAGENTEFRPIGAVEAREAARLRGEYGLRLADALQVAVAVQGGAQAILTNDPVFARVREVRALIVSELE